MPDLLVSVVISTYNRPDRLARLLRSLEAQTLSRSSFEVVVVDDGSDTPTHVLLATEVQRGALQLRTLQHERSRGPAGGRNSGWRAAQAPLIAFTDDDCTSHPEWLAHGVAAAGADRSAIVQGRTQPDPIDLRNDGLLSYTVRVDRLGPQYETCNIFYPREILRALDGFDESFDELLGARPAGEDTDLAWRAIESGYTTVFAPNAIVFHAVERVGLGGILRLAARWGPAVQVLARHPQTRTMLHRGIFWNVWHYLLWRSLVSLAGPRWLWRMLVTMHLRELRKRSRAAGAGGWGVPILIVYDLVECWTVARGAVRYRTLVL